MSSLPSPTTAPGDDDYMQEIAFANRGCICFWMPCFRSETTPSQASSYGSWWWERMSTPEKKEKWWIRGWKNVREWSEIVAGPKWKTFIRRFNKRGVSSYAKHSSFHYDPLSYALNFDDGLNAAADGEDGHSYAGFSARFASVPALATDRRKDAPAST